MHKIEVPAELQKVDELIVPTSYKAMSNDDPAFALFVFYLQAGLVEVLPQKWFTAAQYRVGQQWITRAARDPDSHRIFGECFGVGTFLLEEDGCRLASWSASRQFLRLNELASALRGSAPLVYRNQSAPSTHGRPQRTSRSELACTRERAYDQSRCNFGAL